MFNFALIDKTTGKIVNALSTPNQGVKLVPENENQEVREITLDEFRAIFDGTVRYWNFETQEWEPEYAYKWVLTTPGPYQVGIITLVFEQQNWRGETVTKPTLVSVTVNGQTQQVQVDDGTLELELDCPEPMTFRIKLEAERHETLETEVVVGG